MKKGFKYFLVFVGLAGLGYGGFRFTERIMGNIRLKYAVVHLKSYDTPPDLTPLEE